MASGRRAGPESLLWGSASRFMLWNSPTSGASAHTAQDFTRRQEAQTGAVGTGGPCKSPRILRTGRERWFSASLCVCLGALEAAKWYLKKSHLASVGGKIAAGRGLLGDCCRNPGPGGKTPPSVLLSPRETFGQAVLAKEDATQPFTM